MTKPWDLANFQTGQTPARLRVTGEHGLLPEQRTELQSRFAVWLSVVRHSIAPTHIVSGQLRDGSPYTFKRSIGMCEVLVQPLRKPASQAERENFIAWAVRFDSSYVPPIFERRVYEMPKRVVLGYIEHVTVKVASKDPGGSNKPDIYVAANNLQRIVIQPAGNNSPLIIEGTWNFNSPRVESDSLQADLEVDNFPHISLSSIGLTQDTIGWSNTPEDTTYRWKIVGFIGESLKYDTVVTLYVENAYGGVLNMLIPTSETPDNFSTHLYIVDYAMADSFGYSMSFFTSAQMAAFRNAAKIYGDQIKSILMGFLDYEQDIADEIRDMRRQDRPGILSSVKNYITAGVGRNLHVNAAMLNIPFKTKYTTVEPIQYQTAGASAISNEYRYGGEHGLLHSRYEQSITAAGNDFDIVASAPADLASYKLKQKVAVSSNVFGSQAGGTVVFKRDYVEHHESERMRADTSALTFSTPQSFSAAAGILVQGESAQGYPYIFESQFGVGVDPESSEPQPEKPAELTTVFFEYECADAYTGDWRWTFLPSALAHDAIWIKDERDPAMSETEWSGSRITPPMYGGYFYRIRAVRIGKVITQMRLAAGGWSNPVERTFTPWSADIFTTSLLDTRIVNAVVVARNTPPVGRPVPGIFSPDFLWDGARGKAVQAAKLSSFEPDNPQILIARALTSIGVLKV